MNEHTEGHWTAKLDPITGWQVGHEPTHKLIAKLPAGGITSEADAARIVACVNALAGIPTEDIERNVAAMRMLAEQVSQEYPDSADWKDARARLYRLAMDAVL